MFLDQWLRTGKLSGQPGTTRKRCSKTRRRHCVHRIEFLEDRCLLSAGLLDPTFGGDGMVTTDFTLPDSYDPNSRDTAYDVAVYPGSSPGADGKILAVGSTRSALNNAPSDSDFALVRYNPDGTLDDGFGQGGKVTTPMGRKDDVALAVGLIGDKIVVGGWAENHGVALARYNDDGSLDTTFGNKGKVLNGGLAGMSMFVDSAGKIVVAGPDDKGRLAVTRFTASGALDKTFGTRGIVTTSLPIPLNWGFGNIDAATTPASAGPAHAGKIVVVAGSNNTSSEATLFIARYTTDGKLDPTFGAEGIVTLSGAFGRAGVAVQDDGRIVVGKGRILLRLNPDGTPDTSFDGDGQVTVSIGSDLLRAGSVLIQPDGKIVVAGVHGENNVFPPANFFVARYMSNGTLDPTFGNDGIGLSTEGTVRLDGLAAAAALQANGRIVVAGSTQALEPPLAGYVSDFAVARFLGDDALPTTSLSGQQELSAQEIQPLVAEALTGVDTSSQGLDIRIVDLGRTTPGLGSGNTVLLDSNAARWSWFIKGAPSSGEAELLPSGNQGDQGLMDLLSAGMDELGDLLDQDNDDDSDVMSHNPSAGEHDWPTVVDELLSSLVEEV